MNQIYHYRKLQPRWRTLLLFVALISLLFVVPVLAEYLGPDRRTIELVRVRDPDNDVWTLIHVDPDDGYLDECLIIHTCDEHPSIERQLALCGWIADTSGCDKAYRWKEQEVDLPEATITGDLQNCSLVNGWCTTSSTLHLIGTEPLPGETIIGVEGTRNGEAFYCSGDTCNVPLVEGQNVFTYWALSSYGDSSRMGEKTDLVDTLSPSLDGEVSGAPGENGWWVSQATLSASASDPSPGSGLAAFEISVDGAGWVNYTASIVLDDGQHVVQLRATDYAGHLTETTQTIWVDTQPPQSAFNNPPEGSEIWVAGTLNLAGVSADVTSGLAMIEISYNGGGSWQAIGLNPDGTWSSNWDTRTVPNGTYTVKARAKDVAGNLESTAQITVHVDNGDPNVSIPGSWYIWEPVSISVADSGIGVDTVKLTVHGGSYGNRTYTWANPALVPDDFVWDRRFGDIVAPIGNYPVTVEAWDNLGNRGVDTGTILIPDPGPQAVSTPTTTPTTLSQSTPTQPSPTTTIVPETKPLVSQPSPTSTTRPAVAMSFGDEDEIDGAASTTEKVEPATSPPGGASGLLWGAAALTAAGAATAYALSRRRAREAALAEKRRRAARESSPAARQARLQRLWQQAQARVAPIRSAMRAAAAAAAAAAAEAARRAEERQRAREERILSQQHRGSEPAVEAETEHQPLTDIGVAETEVSPPYDDGWLSPADRAEGYTTPDTPSSFLQIPDDLLNLLPSTSLPEGETKHPVLNLGLFEAGSRSTWHAGSHANPVLKLTPTMSEFDVGPISVKIGWQGNTFETGFSTPTRVYDVDGQGTIMTVKQSGTFSIQWNGWNTTSTVNYNAYDLTVSGSSQTGIYGSRSEGIYFENKPIQTTVLGVVLIGGAVLVSKIPPLAPGIMNILERLLEPVPVP